MGLYGNLAFCVFSRAEASTKYESRGMGEAQNYFFALTHAVTCASRSPSARLHSLGKRKKKYACSAGYPSKSLN